MREIYKVNVSELNQFLETIRTAKNNLNNNSYANFKKSYIYISNNPKISEIKNNLNKKYEKIIDDYNAIIKWLSEYIDDVEKLEKTLSTGTNFVNDVETRNYVNKILANSNVSIPKAHSGNIIRMKIAKYGEDFYNHIVSLNNEEKGKQINRTANYGQVSSDKGEQRKSPSGYATVQGLSNVPTYSRDWRDKKTSSTANNMLNNLNNISVLQYMPKEEKKDPELQKIMDQYGEETAVNYMLYTSFEDRSNELSKIITGKEKELKDAKEELYYINMEVGYGYDGNSGKIIPLQEKIASLEKEIEENIEPLKEELAETNFYLKEAKKNLEISKFASVLTSDKIAWEEDGYSRTFAEEYQNYLKIMKDEKKPDICKYMTEEQANIYCFYYHYMNREHPDLIGTSDDFIKIIEDDINKAKGAEAAAKWIENYEKYKANPNDTISLKNLKGFITQGSLTVGKGFFDGLDSFFDGLKNAVDWNGEITADDYEKMIIAQYIINEGIYDDAYKLSSSFGNMLPSIVTSAVVSAIATPAAGAEVAAKLAPIVGSALMGVSSFGNGINEALVNGHSTSASFMYGLLSGGSEAIVGYFVGKMPFLSKGKDAVSMTMKQTAKEYIKDLLKEGFEELTQEVFDAVFRNICLGEAIDFDSLPTDMRDSFCMGVLMSYALSGGPYKTARFVIDGIEYNIKLSDLADQLYTNGHLNKNLTKSEIKRIIKNGYKGKTNYSPADLSMMLDEYNNIRNGVSSYEMNNYIRAKNNNDTILYNPEITAKYDRIIELQNIFEKNGIKYNYLTDNIINMPNNVVNINPQSNNVKNNAGMLDIGVFGDIIKNIFKSNKTTTSLNDVTITQEFMDNYNKNLDSINQKIKEKTPLSNNEITYLAGDPKQYLYNKYNSIFKDNEYVSIPCEMTIENMLSFLGNNVTNEDKQMIKYMIDNKESLYNVTESFTDEEKYIIGLYTANSGNAICDDIRGLFNTKTEYGKKIYEDYANIDSYIRSANNQYLYSLADSYHVYNNSDFYVELKKINKKYKSFNNISKSDIVRNMDSVINKSVIKNEVVVYRGCDGIYKDGSKLDISKIVPGTKFTETSYVSTSLSMDSGYINPAKVCLEITVPEGTNGAYLQSYSGVHGFSMEEILLGRNTNFEVTGYPYKNNGVVVIPIKVVK